MSISSMFPGSLTLQAATMVAKPIERPIFAGYPAFASEVTFWLSYCESNVAEWHDTALETVESMIMDGFKAKTPIKHMLSLGSDYRRIVRHESAVNYDNVVGRGDWYAVANLLEHVTGEWVYSDTQISWLTEGMKDKHGRLVKPMRWLANWEREHKASLIGKDAVERLIGKIAEAKRMSVVDYVISANPMDIFFNSANSSYSSCMDIRKTKGTESHVYKGGLTTYAADPGVFIIFRADPRKASAIPYKTGRILCLLDNQANGIGICRGYGDVSPVDAKNILAQITGMIDAHTSFEVGTDEFSGYFDYVSYALAAPGYSGKLGMNLMSSFCLACGEDSDASDCLVCSACETEACSYCDSCNESMAEDDTYIAPNGEQYCHECYYDIYDNCSHCGDTTERDSMIEVHGYNYCEYCINRRYSRCFDCNDLERNNEMSQINNREICRDCVDNYAYCNSCETYHGQDEVSRSISNDMICDDCMATEPKPTATQALQSLCGYYARINCRYVARVWVETDKAWAFVAMPDCFTCQEANRRITEAGYVGYALPREFVMSTYS